MIVIWKKRLLKSVAKSLLESKKQKFQEWDKKESKQNWGGIKCLNKEKEPLRNIKRESEFSKERMTLTKSAMWWAS